ncbi:ABC transporter permease [Antrihabitans cavernicola]|uniref:ABC transporter permease n=1 Tax=Antrihabitans cavernicola TaxID=2495913 RepID=A0A5A7S6Y4_9NOCA|nr:ABC transporter permease [Spelaeibacter cavernicola]KAA0019434.1 ABC transporter permease [Spelaeibacter cavernicola]
MAVTTTYVPPLLRPLYAMRGLANGPVALLARMGHQLYFFIRAVAAIPLALKHYRKEVWRLLSDVTWGNGALVVGGGTIGVILLLSAFGGMTVGMEGYTSLNLLGMGPLTGALSAFATTREIGPLLAALAFAAQAGCRFTAQLGSMRIAEEIDALESVAIRPLPYLVSTRILAAVVAIVPLYVLGLGMAYLSCKVTVGFIGGQSSGTYMHYFYQFIVSKDVLYSILKAVIFVMLTTFIQCYYGFFAAGGPEGVGVAAGRAIKMCIIIVVFANLFMTLAIWGVDPGIRISG